MDRRQHVGTSVAHVAQPLVVGAARAKVPKKRSQAPPRPLLDLRRRAACRLPSIDFQTLAGTGETKEGRVGDRPPVVGDRMGVSRTGLKKEAHETIDRRSQFCALGLVQVIQCGIHQTRPGEGNVGLAQVFHIAG